MVENVDHVLVHGAEYGPPLDQGPAQVTRPLHIGQQQRGVAWEQK